MHSRKWFGSFNNTILVHSFVIWKKTDLVSGQLSSLVRFIENVVGVSLIRIGGRLLIHLST